MTEAVSPLLCFQDATHEAAAVACLHRRYAQGDWRLFTSGSISLFIIALRVRQAGHWPRAMLAEALLLVLLHRVSARYPHTFLRWRSLLMAAFNVGHSLVSRGAAPMLFGPSCPHLLSFALREFNISQAFWTLLLCVSYPIPLKHAVWSQGATVASLLAYLPQMRANSLARCAASEQHFQRAARALTAAAGAALPGPLAAAVHDLPRRLGPSGAFYAVHLALLLSSYLATLWFLFRFELGHRRLFARQHRLAAEAAALLYRKRQLALSLPALLLLCAIGWIACCFAVLFCFRVAALLHWLALHFVHALMLGIM